MGAICSQKNCDIICQCFIHDKNVKDVEVVRDLKEKWLWTNDHESALFTFLTSKQYNYNVPTDIINLIKELSYSNNQHFYITQRHIYQEKYYSKSNKLLKKPLCKLWYFSKLSNLSPYPVAIISPS